MIDNTCQEISQYPCLKPLNINKMPTISLVTPSYNSGKTISAAIESVLDNRYPYLDYLVVDAKSKDNTAAIATQYCPSVRVLSEPDDGQSDAINKGFKLTKGDIFGWLNADDILYPGSLKKVGDFFLANPTAIGVYGDSVLIDENGSVISKSGVQSFDRWRLIHSRNFIEQQSCFFRRDAFEAVCGLDISLKYVMDWDLWIKLSMLGDLVYIPDVLSARRMTSSNKTQSGGVERLFEIYRMLHHYGATWRSPVMLNYIYETFATQAQWGAGLLGTISKILYPVFISSLSPWFNHNMNIACYGSYPDGSIPPKGAVVIPHYPGFSTLLLKFWPTPDKDVLSYRISIRINGKLLDKVTLKSGATEPVECRIGNVNFNQLNLLEFSASRSVESYEASLSKSVRKSAKLKWGWLKES